jgi:hypothetical protein
MQAPCVILVADMNEDLKAALYVGLLLGGAVVIVLAYIASRSLFS